MRNEGTDAIHAIGTHQNPGLVVHHRLELAVHVYPYQNTSAMRTHAKPMTSR
jgi:hypothetical protein